MKPFVTVYDPSAEDELSRVRGVGRYMQILRENFPDWKFSADVILANAVRPGSIDSGQARMTSDLFINPFINFLQPPVITKRIARRQIAIIHDLIPLKYPAHFPAGIRGRLNILRNRRALRHYDAIVTDSEASKKDIVEILKIGKSKVNVIYPCLPKIFINPKSKIQMSNQAQSPNSQFSILNAQFCLYVGDVTWNKNLVNLARAVKKADVTCVFVGKAFSDLRKEKGKRKNISQIKSSAWLAEFNEFAKLAEDDERFVFPGYISDKELVGLYTNARANILVSRDEGFGFSFLEAASVGTPSILANIPVFQEISSDSALYADPNNPDDIAQKFRILFDDGEYWRELKSRAQKRSESFSPEKFRNDFSNLFVQ